METSQVLVTVLGAGGGGAALLALINGLIKWLSGSSARERSKNTDLVSQRRNAIEEREEAFRDRDVSDTNRRITEEYASSLRRMLLENGITPDPWPKKVTAQTLKNNDSKE